MSDLLHVYKRWWKQSRHRFLPWIMLNSMRRSVLCSPLVLLIANYPQRDGQVEVTSCWLRARMSYMPADGYPSYLTNWHRQLQESETHCNKSWGSVEVLWRCRGIFDYYLFLQIYGGVCSHRILNIGQHLAKLWIRKLIVSGSLCQEHCNTESTQQQLLQIVARTGREGLSLNGISCLEQLKRDFQHTFFTVFKCFICEIHFSFLDFFCTAIP